MPRKKTPVTICRRCGKNPPRPGPRTQVCEECYGKCRVCGKPAGLDSEGFPKPRCPNCIANESAVCNKCGAPRQGSKYAYECIDCGRRYQREYKRRTKGQPNHRKPPTALSRRQKQLTSHGLTITSYEELLERQGGVCATCGELPKTFHIDHCHTNGHVRGLLCNNCNAALGFAKDQPPVLRRMADYLER